MRPDHATITNCPDPTLAATLRAIATACGQRSHCSAADNSLARICCSLPSQRSVPISISQLCQASHGVGVLTTCADVDRYRPFPNAHPNLV